MSDTTVTVREDLHTFRIITSSTFTFTQSDLMVAARRLCLTIMDDYEGLEGNFTLPEALAVANFTLGEVVDAFLVSPALEEVVARYGKRAALWLLFEKVDAEGGPLNALTRHFEWALRELESVQS